MDNTKATPIEKEGWVKYLEPKGKKKTLWAVLRRKHVYLFHSKRKLEEELVVSITINEKTKISKGADKKAEKGRKCLEIQSKNGDFVFFIESSEGESWFMLLNQKVEDMKSKKSQKESQKTNKKKVAPPVLQSEPWTVQKKLEYLRVNTIGRNVYVKTPYMWDGVKDVENYTDTPMTKNQTRVLVYEDFTASGRSLRFVDNYIMDIMKLYANTHTEINATGSATSRCFEKAFEIIIKHVHAPSNFFVLPVGAGVTGAIEKIQKILGVYIPPKQKKDFGIQNSKTVAFVLPYEHHSNDISWQENTTCEFVRIKCTKDYLVDTVDLEEKLKHYSEENYKIIASFSACSNVTGTITDVRGLTSLVKKYNGIVLCDYAASGPYADINMTKDGMDAIFLSPHKNLGGPGSCGILVGNPALYDSSSPPSFCGGGTVNFVTPWKISYHEDITSREMAGTPPIRDVFQVALSLQLKDWFGIENIEKIEATFCKEFLDYFTKHPRVSILGNQDPEKRIPIISLLFRHNDKVLHQHFGCVLLNDFFGIQTRSGCSCAGPWGHELLNMSQDKSDAITKVILSEIVSLKPGWVRLGLHYTMTREEFEYTKFAINALAWFGHLFLTDYLLDVHTGTWIHKSPHPSDTCSFGIEDAVRLDVEGSPTSRMYIPMDPDTEDERNAQLLIQKEEFIRYASFRIMYVFCPGGSLSLYQAIFPVVKKFLTSYVLETKTLEDELVIAITTHHTAYTEADTRSIVQDEILAGNLHNNKNIFPEDVNKWTFFYCASGKVACACAKKGNSNHAKLTKLNSLKGRRGTFF